MLRPFDKILASLILCVALCTGEQVDKKTEVKISTGRLLGIRKTIRGIDLNVYYGIPYVAPPLGDLRFRKPAPSVPWSGVYEAKQYSASCIQTYPCTGAEIADRWRSSTNQSEDCLYLNVWAPASGTPTGGRHVLLWIHGGSYVVGSASAPMYDATYLSALQDIIVVTINYRLGPLGFLYTGDESAPGNAGLWDQIAAMDWVRKNIEFFGGNPNAMSIIGESAGGSAVTIHLLSPVSRDKYKRAVVISGTVNIYWSYRGTEDSKAKTNLLIEKANCSKKEDPVQCLREVPALALENIADGLKFPDKIDMFVPTIDNVILPRDPKVMMQNGEFKHHEQILMGTAKNEGSYLSLYYPPHFSYKEDLVLNSSETDAMLDTILPNHITTTLRGMVEVLYFNTSDGKSNRDGITQLFTDMDFICPSMELASAFNDRNNTVYYYQFNYPVVNRKVSWIGPTHGDDVDFFLGKPFRDRSEYIKHYFCNESDWNARKGAIETEFTEDEKLLSESMMINLKNFLTTGNPSRDHEDWAKLSSKGREYTIITGRGVEYDRNLRGSQCLFWNELVPKFQDQQQEPQAKGSTEISEGSRVKTNLLIMLIAMFLIAIFV